MNTKKHEIINLHLSNPERLKWVVIECPYLQWNNPEVQYWFNQYVSTKKAGFEVEYPTGVLPFGTYDFIADLLFIVDRDTNQPLCVLKSTNQKTCESFHLKEELSSFLHANGYLEHYHYMNQATQVATSNHQLLGYMSSWTIPPEAATHPFKKIAKEVVMGLLYHYCTHFGIQELIASGAVRFKVPVYLNEIGFDDILGKDGKEMSEVTSPFLFGEKSIMKHLKSFSLKTIQCAQKYESLWLERTELRLPSHLTKKRAA